MGKSKLLNTVADVAASSNRGVPPVRAALLAAEAGFSFKSIADTANGRAVQTIAYACMVLWANWKLDGAPESEENGAAIPVPELVDVVIAKEKDLRATLKRWFVDAILGDPRDTKGMEPEEWAAVELQRTAKVQQIARGMGMAGILLKCGVTYADYNHKDNTFEVAPSLLLMRNQVPVGRLAKENMPVLLNKREYAIMQPNKDGKETFGKVVASVDQLNRAARERHELKPARTTNGRFDLAKASPRTLADGCNIATLVEALAMAFVRNGNRQPVSPDKLAPEVWTMLSDIAQESDAIQTSDMFKAYIASGITSDAEVAPASEAQAA